MSLTEKQHEETLADLIKEIWAGRGFVLGGLLVGLVFAFGFMALAVPHSEAQVVLAPANPMNMSSVNKGKGGSGGEQSSQENLSFARFEVSFKGAAVAGLLLRDPEITAGLQKDRAFQFSRTERGWSPEKLAEYISERVVVDPVGERLCGRFPTYTLIRTLPWRFYTVCIMLRMV